MRQMQSHTMRMTASAALLLAALCGCAGRLETDGGATARPLGFDALVEDTRADLKDDFISGDKFKVWAKRSGEISYLLDGATVSYDGSAWSYSGSPYLWKAGQTITFVAHSPETLSGNVTPNANGIAISNYTLNQSQDLLLGYYSGTGNDGKAPLAFRHALAALEFRLGEDAPGWVTDITKISVTAPSKGNCTADFSSGTSIVWSSQGTNATVNQNLTDQSKASGAVIGTPFLELPNTNGSFTVTVTVSYSGTQKDLSLTKCGVTLVPGGKNIYSVYLPKKIDADTISLTAWTTSESSTPITVEE